MSSKPSSVEEVLQKTLSSYRLDKKVEQYSAFPEWREIVGKETANVASPVKIIRGKILVVRVLDSAWAQELSMSKQSLIEKLNQTETGAIIEDIQFLTGDPTQISKASNE